MKPARRFERWSETAVAWLIPLLILTETALLIALPATEESARVPVSEAVISPAALWIGRATALSIVSILLISLPSRLAAAHRSYRPVAIGYLLLWTFGLLLPALASGLGSRPYAYLYPLIVCLLFATASREGYERALNVLTWVVLPLTLGSLMLYFVKPEWVADVYYEEGIGASFPRLFGFTQQANLLGATLLPWLLVLLRQSAMRPLLRNAALAVGILALLASQSKTSIIALAVCGAYLILFTWPQRIRRLIIPFSVLAASMAAGGLLLAMALDLLPRLTADEAALISSGTGRNIIWDIALRVWSANPVLGYGPDLFVDGAFFSVPEMRTVAHAHNQFIDLLARSGLLGLLSLIVMLGILIRGLWRIDPAQRPLGIALMAALLIQSATETPISLAGNTLLAIDFWLLLGFVSSHACAAPRSSKASTARIDDGGSVGTMAVSAHDARA